MATVWQHTLTRGSSQHWTPLIFPTSFHPCCLATSRVLKTNLAPACSFLMTLEVTVVLLEVLSWQSHCNYSNYSGGQTNDAVHAAVCHVLTKGTGHSIIVREQLRCDHNGLWSPKEKSDLMGLARLWSSVKRQKREALSPAMGWFFVGGVCFIQSRKSTNNCKNLEFYNSCLKSLPPCYRFPCFIGA